MRKCFKITFCILITNLILFHSCLAYESISKENNKGIFEISYDVFEAEETTFFERIKKTINENGQEFEYVKFDKTEDESNIKSVDKEIVKKNLSTNNVDTIKSMEEKIYNYNEDGYLGELQLSAVEVVEVDNGTHEEIEKLDIPFENIKINDLSYIEKMIEQNGKIYYLVGVDWEYQSTENIDNTVVATTYKGIKHYETIINVANPKKYNAIIHYSGNVKSENCLYHYKLLYKEIPRVEPEIEIEEKNNYAVPVIIISTVGIVLVILLVILKNKKDKKRR